MADLTLDITQALAALAEYDKRLQALERGYSDVDQAARTFGQSSKQSLVTSGDAARSEAAAINRLQKEYQETAQSVQALKRALNGTYDPRVISNYTKAIAGGEQALRKMEGAARDLGVKLKSASKEASTGTQVFEGLFGQLTKATIIIALIEQVRKLSAEALRLADNYKKLTNQFKGFVGSGEAAEKVLANLNKFALENSLNPDVVTSAGRALLGFGFAADELIPRLARIGNVAAGSGKDFNELALIYGKARAAGVLMAEDVNQLTEAGIPIIVQFAKQMGVSADQVKKLASEGKISFAELELAFAQLSTNGGLYADQLAASADTLTAKWQKFKTQFSEQILKPAGEALGEFLSNALDGIQVLGDQINNGFDIIFDNKAYRARVRERLVIQQEESEKAAEQEVAAIADLNKKAEDERLRLAREADKKRAQQRENERKRRLAEEEAYNKRLLELSIERLNPQSEARAIAQENLRFTTLLKEFKKFGLATEDVEAQHLQNLFNIRADFYQKRLDQQRAAEQAELTDLNNFLADRQEAFEAQRDINDETIGLAEERSKAFILRLREQGASEREIQAAQEEFALLTQKARLQNELQFQENLLLITDAGNTEQVNRIKRQIELIRAQLENVNFQIDNPAEEQKTFSIWRAFGIDPDSDEGQRAIESFRQSAAQFQAIVSSMVAARVAEADAAVDAADRKVAAAEDALQREIDLQNQGFAANVQAAEQGLAAARSQRERAAEEQRRAARTQLAVDAAQQASNIALSVTNLYKSWSSLPFGIGLLAAAAQAASLIALIASVRSRARALSQPQQFRKGGGGWLDESGFINGRTHEQGGHLLEVEHGELLQVGDDGGRRRVSIVRRERVRDYFNLLDAANRDDKRAVFQHAMALASIGSGPEINRDVFARSGSSAKSGSSGTVKDNRELQRLVEIQRRMLDVLLDNQSGERWSPDGKVLRRGNQIIKFS